MRLLVFGASGKTGHALVRQAIDRGHTVTAFVRTPGKLTITDPSVRVLGGNVADSAAVASAIPGHDALVSALGVSKPLTHDADVIAGNTKHHWCDGRTWRPSPDLSVLHRRARESSSSWICASVHRPDTAPT